MFSLICARVNCWVNNREAGDLRRHRAHYDVIVMKMEHITHWGRDKMATIFQTTFQMHFLERKCKNIAQGFTEHDDQVNNMPALVKIMAWRRQGDKPISEPKMVILLIHICFTRPQWVNIMYIYCHTGNVPARLSQFKLFHWYWPNVPNNDLMWWHYVFATIIHLYRRHVYLWKIKCIYLFVTWRVCQEPFLFNGCCYQKQPT